ncbi:hypothetical protein [Pseudomonas mandelii]|uniref:Uncharacterized protein n=1 Tax=Pseudomonas mandelii TaxID=75612 RepID=A0AB36CQR7_9PSED|nr:hypothetical protein [Pseudomonas mandelii]NMZ78413.1 hypothetical protein [Pseudomonas mandelii]
MPTFKVRTYEENREVVADKLEFCPDGIRFYTGDKVTAAFSRYLWVQEEPAAETLPEASDAPLPLPTPDAATDTQPE